MEQFLRKYRSILLYGFFGVCTTLVNIAVYWFSSHILHLSVTVSTALAWILSVLFAYVTNRKWVFESRVKGTYSILKEMASFFASRLSTGLLDWLIMFTAVEKMGLNDMAVKICSNVIVIILNYVLGRLVVFRKR